MPISSCNTSTLYSESTSILSFPISEFSTSNPLVQKIKQLWTLIIEGNLLKFNQQRCLRLLQRIYSIHLSVEEIKDNIGHGVYRQENLYDFEEIMENLNDILQQIETFIEYNKNQWIIRRLLNATYINYQFETWKNQIKVTLEDFSYHYSRYSPNRNFDSVLKAWEEQDQTDLINDDQNLIEKLEKTWKALIKASKDSHGISVQQQKVLNILEINRSNIKELITGIQRLIFCQELNHQERITHSFAKITLEIIQKMFRYRINPFPWAVTSWEIIDVQTDLTTKINEFSENSTIFDQYKVAFFREHVPVTIKTIKKRAVKVDFINNLIIWSNIKHENILPFLGANIVVPQPYIINPFLSNGNMIGYLNEFPDKALKILNEVCCAVKYLHMNNIVHGDLKGFNVLIDKEGVAKITNFGIYCIPHIRSMCDLSPERYPWSAPELIDGICPTQASDIYSFGILCYEAFFEGDTYERTYIECLLSHMPQNVSSAPKEIWEVMQECWQSNPLLRPSIDKVKSRLEEIIEDFKTDTSNSFITNKEVDDETDTLEQKCNINIKNIQSITTSSYKGILDDGSFVFIKNYPWLCLQQRKTKNNNNTLKSMIAKEIQTFQNIDHQNILNISDYSISDGYFSTFSSFIEQGNINDFIESHDVDIDQRIKFMKDISNGLMYLHKNGIIHGNLRGSHILIDENSQIKITEYGMPQLQNKVNQSILPKYNNNNNSVVIHYNCWTAPELFLRNYIPTVESDVYSFGMVCYEILANNQPFEYIDIRELKENVCIYKIKPLRSKIVDVLCPDWLWELMCSCWISEYNERKSLIEIQKIFENAPQPDESDNEDTLINFGLAKHNSILRKSTKINSLMQKINNRHTNKLSTLPEKSNTVNKKTTTTTTTTTTTIVSDSQVKQLPVIIKRNERHVDRNINQDLDVTEVDNNNNNNNQSEAESEKENGNFESNRSDHGSFSDSSISTMTSGELETYIQSIQNNSVTALLTDTDLATLKYKSSIDSISDCDSTTSSLERSEYERNQKKMNRRSISSRFSFRSMNRSSSIFSVNVYEEPDEYKRQSFYITDGMNSKKKSSNRTLKKWSISADAFLSMARKTFRHDANKKTREHERKPSINKKESNLKKELKSENDIKKEKMLNNQRKLNELINEEDDEDEGISVEEEIINITKEKKHEPSLGSASIQIEQQTIDETLVKDKFSKCYPSPTNSLKILNNN